MSTETKNRIILRNAYGPAVPVIYINPTADSRGIFPDCVRRVDSKGDMILSEKDKESGIHFIPENAVIEIHDGYREFDLNDPVQKNLWKAIENSPIIAKDRLAKDSKGNLLIDGTTSSKSKQPRYGIAELYVDNPNLEAERKVKRADLICQAYNFIHDDTEEHKRTLTKILGRRMSNMPIAEVTSFLYQLADKNPDKVIKLYTGGDTALRILLIEAKEKRVIVVKDKLYMYADTVLGATDDAVISFMKESKNKEIVDLIKQATFPDMEINNA